MLIQESDTGDDLLMQHPHVAAGFFVAGAYLSPERVTERVEMGSHLLSEGRKLHTHILAELHNLRYQ